MTSEYRTHCGQTPDEQDMLRQLRTRVKARLQARKEYPQSGRVGQNTPIRDGETTSVHVQKATSATSIILSDDSDDDTHDSAVEQLESLENQMRCIFGGMAITSDIEHFRCHLEYCDRLAFLSQTPVGAYATADSGADTSVLGKEYSIVATDPVRKVNLIGFDETYARKKGLSIVTADTLVRTADGDEIILRAHQSVSNPSTSTTFLSEVQLRHARHVMDSVHKDHFLTIGEEKGTQASYLRQVTDEGEFVYKIPFLQRAVLMSLKHRKPDEMDYARGLPIVSLTLEGRWDPHAHFDDNGEVVIDPLANIESTQYKSDADIINAQKMSTWHHSETYIVFQPDGEQEEIFHDSSEGTDRQFYRRAFYLDNPQHWRR
jgi:hypothetical protein